MLPARIMRSILTDHDVKLLTELYRQLPSLTWAATNALRIFPPAKALEGADLTRFLEAHAKVVETLAKMTHIVGK